MLEKRPLLTPCIQKHVENGLRATAALISLLRFKQCADWRCTSCVSMIGDLIHLIKVCTTKPKTNR